MPIYVPDTTSNQESSGFLGAPADVSPDTLDAENRVIKDTDAAITICDSLVYAWSKGIFNSSRITAKLNGERPWGKAQLKQKGMGHKKNVSTRFLMQQCAKIAPRFYMPIRTASTLTAASLPDGWPDGPVKTDKFRKRLTKTIRAWKKWNYFIEGMAREVTDFGLGYAVWFDEYDWRPTLIRMDKGFVPQGTEIMDHDMQFFCVKWQYHPNDLLKLVKESVEAGRTEWKKAACVEAINKAAPPAVGPTFDKFRDYEDLIRQSVWSIAYYKAMRLIDTYHLFVKEHTGKVSHYILWRDGTKTGDDNGGDSRLLYEFLDEYESISEVCIPTPFGYGDGSIQGSWGAGQLLFDMANQVEISRNEAMDAQSNQNKLKLQVAEGKNVNDVKLTISGDMMTVEGAQFAQPGAAMPSDSSGFKMLDDEFTMWAQQIVGNFIPPIPLQPSDTKAASINAAQAGEQEVQAKNLDNFLMHIAYIISTISKRMANPMSPDDDARKFRDGCLNEDKLTEQEIDYLVNQPSVETIIDFTPANASARAQFAASRTANPASASLYQPRKLEEIQAQAVPGGKAVIEYAMVPEQDGTVEPEAQRQQTLENTTLGFGQDVGVLAQDRDWTHMQTQKPVMEKVVMGKNVPGGLSHLRHYAAHYTAGVAKKTIPPDQVNAEKSYIAEVEKAINAVQTQAQQQQGQPPVPQQAAPAPVAQ